MPKDMKRMHYFNGLLLKQEDLTLDQEYHKRAQRLHNRYFHNWGIVTGLEVEKSDQTSVVVKPGLALNRVFDPENNEEISQEIVISDTHPARVLDLSGYSTSDQVYITVSYKEVLADPDLVKGGGQEIHVWEIAELNSSSSRPADERKDILLARVTLKHNPDGTLAIDQIAETDVDGTDLVTRALGGATLKAEKIIIGPNEDPELPYFSGPAKESGENANKLYVHAPLTEFTGNVRAESLDTSGPLNVNGPLTVSAGGEQSLRVDASGDVEMAGTVTIAGPLTAKNGIEVSGGMATLDVPQVVISGNLVTLNKNADARNVSGVEIVREDQPSAKLLWDEQAQAWKIGTDKKEGVEGGGLYNVAYGPDWERLHGKGNADTLHTHTRLHSEDGLPALSTDTAGNIMVEHDLTVNGSLVAKKGGLEVSRGETLPNARIAWNEEARSWQIGTGSDMTDIPDGAQWEELTGGQNADGLHTHSQFHNEDKSKLALEIGADGNVNIPHELMVGETLTVNKLIVREEEILVKKVEQEVADSYITVNKAEDGDAIDAKGGLEVYRGRGHSPARLEWNENERKWKVGIEGSLSDIPYGSKWDSLTGGAVADAAHKHSALTTSSGGTVLSADDQGKLTALGNVEIGGALLAKGDADLQGALHVGGSATIDGNLTVKGKTTFVEKQDLVVISNRIELNKSEGNSQTFKQSSIEVYRGSQNPSARLVWDETDRRWKFGIGDELSNIAYGSNWDALTSGVNVEADGLHKHNSLADRDGRTVVRANNEGNLEIENDAEVAGTLTVNQGAEISGGLAVDQLRVNGNLVVNGKTTTVEREDLVVTNNMIEINKYEGDAPAYNESGIEVYRGETQPAAKIIWNESERKWKVGTGSALETIASGSSWEKLTQTANADSLHLHSQLFNPQTDILALSASAEGDVDVHHDLTVGNHLTVAGNLEVRGTTAAIMTDKLTLGSALVTLNKDGGTVSSAAGGGIEVFRGGEQPAARIGWDEAKAQWTIGTSSASSALTVDAGGNVNAAGSLKAASVDIQGTLTAGSAVIAGTVTVGDGLEVPHKTETKAQIKWVKDRWNLGTAGKTVLSLTRSGRMGVGTDNPTEALDVAGKALFRTEAEFSGAASFSGTITAHKTASFEAEASFNKGIQATDVAVSQQMRVSGTLVAAGGLETPRGLDASGKDLPNARIYWNNEQKAWFYSDGVTSSEFGVGKGGMNKLYNEQGDTVAVYADNQGRVGIGTTAPLGLLEVKIMGDNTAFSVTEEGDVGIGTYNPQARLDVKGNAAVAGTLMSADAVISNNLTVAGNLTVNGDIVTINTATLEVEDNIIRVNKYSPQPVPLVKNGGLEVFRGGTALPAQLLWDETADQWLAGVSDSLRAIEFKGHSHPEFTPLLSAMTVDSGNIGIGTAAPAAKLDVNGNAAISGRLTVGELQISGSFGVTNMTISDTLTVMNGVVNNVLTAKDIAASGMLTAEKATVNQTLTAKDITVSNTLTAKDAVVSSAITVKDATVSNALTSHDAMITNTLVAKDVVFSGSVAVSRGVEVNRGTEAKAQILWDETADEWQLGVAGQMKGLAYNDHTHRELTALGSVLTVASGNLGVGTAAPKAKLDVTGNAAFSGKLSADEAEIAGAWTAASADITGTLAAKDITAGGTLAAPAASIASTLTAKDITASGTLTAADAIISGSLTVSQGVEVSRGAEANAQLLWNEELGEWQAGIQGSLKQLAYSDHTHSELSRLTGVITVNDSLNVGIGKTASDDYKLDVEGNLRAANFAQTSSRTLKENIASLPGKKALELLNKLKPVTFNYKAENGKKQNIGFIAEEVPTIFATNDHKSVVLMDIIAVLTTVVQKQQKEAGDMRKRVDALQAQVSALTGA
ncbi:tail fiber domain-containing protein [Paenibacillus macerans]|uniref:tail fiber domain-containing protein n=1 Tax=Paenibacillus macerans TaxID=44252 RepID=UPI00203CAAD5|nr:tail fiber domain-containing protein [Paenibacillus macerans]MCM3702366.1 tail fiber domain-containing protein [Paenibacillus macerans]